MNEAEYGKLKQRVAIALKKFNGNSDEQEDATQDILCAWLSRGFKRGQTVDQAVIDYLRKQSGRKGTSGYQQRLNLHNASSTEGLRDLGIEPRVGGDCNDIAKLLRGRDRRLFMSLAEGETLLEIANRIGLSESRVCQMVKEINSKLKRILYLADLFSGLDLDETDRQWVQNVIKG